MHSTTKTPGYTKTKDMAYIAVFAVLIAVCSWISIPTTVPFTLQTFAVFLTVGVLGGKRGSMAVLVYILLGCVGVPVFAGFSGGIGVLAGQTGGYIVGFLFSALVMWGIERMAGTRLWVQAVSMVLGLLACYAVGIGTVLGWCVIPFILPDLVKIALAVLMTRRLSPILRNL